MAPSTSGPAPDLSELKFRTFAELLETWAREHGPDVILHLLSDSNPNKSLDVTYRDLYDRARAKAAALQERGVRKGEKVVLVLPTGIEFVACFFGTVLAGAVPVPAYPPFGLGKLDEYLDRLVGIVTDSEAVAVCTTRAVFGVIGQALARMPGLRDVYVASQLVGDVARFTPVALEAEDTVLLQYTSGSTGTQKGVELSHRNILSNLHGIGLGVEVREGVDVGACWLPLCHDMGLIGCLLWCSYWRVALVLMSPQAFIGDPKRWLWGIHKYRVTLSPAPNFAYDICARRIPEEDVAGLDLSSWRVAFNGAEPVSFISLDAFSARFGAHGFKRTALFPVYGLAEDSLAAAFPVPGADVVI
ncbi:MAG TPA: AMP-binding protein, partial [Polyangia bacterium]